MDAFERMEAAVAEARKEADKFYNKNNDSAGTRLRKAMQEIKIIAQEVRNEVIDIRKSR